MPIAVSACLLGEPCRYDGKSRPCEDVLKLHDACEMVPVCPEVLGGLPVPHAPCEIAAAERALRVTDADGVIVSSPDRRLVWMAQTPQVFELELIREALRRQLMEDCSRITDDAMVVERQMGVRVHMVEGSYENIKITTPEDILVAEALLTREVK